MTKNCAFTICTKNYIGLAQVLEKSIFEYYSDIDFYIFVADEFDPTQNICLPNNVKVIKDLNLIPSAQWINFSFKYDLTEFCTTLKPFVFKYLFENTKYEKICYFDPDILFFSSIENVFTGLDNALIELTPHFVTFPENEVSRRIEDETRLAGIFNLGFCGLKRNQKVLKMLNWWANNLSDKGFSNPDKTQFTDQKWMDFMPLFFDKDELNINKNIGMNAAPWNFFERKTYVNKNIFYVQLRDNSNSVLIPIVFVHFSGFNYKKLLNENVVEEKHENHSVNYGDIELLMNEYAAKLRNAKDDINHYLGLSYSYDVFETGEKIDSFQRRLYDAYCRINKNYQENPFNEKSLFYKKLNKNKLLTYINNSTSESKLLMKNIDFQFKKVQMMSKIFRLFFKLLGYSKYVMFIRFLKKFCKADYQVFLLDENLVTWNIGQQTRTTDNRQQTTDNRQQTTDNRQQTTDNRQQNYVIWFKFVKIFKQKTENIRRYA